MADRLESIHPGRRDHQSSDHNVLCLRKRSDRFAVATGTQRSHQHIHAALVGKDTKQLTRLVSDGRTRDAVLDEETNCVEHVGVRTERHQLGYEDVLCATKVHGETFATLCVLAKRSDLGRWRESRCWPMERINNRFYQRNVRNANDFIPKSLRRIATAPITAQSTSVENAGHDSCHNVESPEGEVVA